MMNLLAATASLSLCTCAAAAGWQRNFADNPSAEADRNRDGLPDGWRPATFRSPAKVAWDKSVAHTGNASLRISDSKHPTGNAWDENTGRWIGAARRKVAPGQPYTLGAWVRTRGVTGNASACIAWWHGGNWLAESYTKRLTGTGDWQWVDVRATTPPKADAAQIYLCLSRSTGTAWFDDIIMVQGSRLPGNFRPVDIAPACNTGFRDDVAGDGRGGWTDQGKNDIRTLPTGSVRLRGVPFHIVSPQQNAGKSCIVLKGKGREGFPAAVAVALGRKCETLYFLHCCAWGRRGARVGHYELVYEDGSTARIALTCDRQIHDWWRCFDTPEAAVGWEGKNAESDSIGLGILPAANPQPAKAIQEVRFASAGAAVPILVALTTADGPPVLTEPVVRYEFTDTAGWYPFNFPLDDTNRDSIDLSGFLDPPAGKHGFLAVRPDGHFYFADGTRARFFGTNICSRSAFPAREEARVIAARLAKYGVNLLRIHAIDGRWAPLIDYAKGNSRHLSPDALDRLDFFFAELKTRGIYIYFDLLDYRRFMDADGVRDASKFQEGWHNTKRGASIFNPRLVELQKEFATKFLTHRNPYTRLRYCDDPALAVVEITNENSLFYFCNTTLTLPTYVDELRQRWNQWLLKAFGQRPQLAEAWTNAAGQCALLPDEDPAKGTVHLPLKDLYQDPDKAPFVGRRSPARVSAMVRFFYHLEARLYKEMRDHLRTIGVRVPITGTNQHFCPASTFAESSNDFMSRNNYWQHPNVRAKPFVRFRNLAVVNSNLATTMNPIAEIAASSVVGKPMISPEFNFPWPNEYRAECLPLMAAYACLQDWDGLLFFAYSPGRKALEHFGNQSDPVRWGQFPAAALLFHRRDVSVARETVHVGYSEKDVFTARPSHRRAASSPFRCLPYISKVRNAYFKDTYGGDATLVRGATYVPRAQKRYVSDTAELSLDPGRGLFTIDTPRTQAAVGFLAKAGPVELATVTIDCQTPFAAVMVTSLDAEPIGESRRVLVTAVARAENTGQAFTKNRSALAERGRPPVLVEPVDARLTFPVPDAPTVFCLDETGRRGRQILAEYQAGRIRLPLAGAHSPWCEVVVVPPAPATRP